MSMNESNPKVDAFLKKAKKWQAEMELLRGIIRTRKGLGEDLKWGKPCYTVDGANVVLIVGFKEYCSLIFPKGALLKDPEGILVKAGENTQAARQMRFTAAVEVKRLERAVKAYVDQAIAVQKAGLEVPYKKITEYAIPAELQEQYDKRPALKAAFEALTPGRQRGYLMHFSRAKQSQTRASRVEKCIPQILKGKGLHD